MKTNMMYLAAALLLAACSPKESNMTRLVAQFGEDAPDSVRIVIGATNMPSLDTIVFVKNGRLDANIPKNLVGTACLFPGNTTFQSDELYAGFPTVPPSPSTRRHIRQSLPTRRALILALSRMKNGWISIGPTCKPR